MSLIKSQQGMATLVSTMVLLVLFAAFVMGSYSITSSQSKAVNNTKAYSEALSAAKYAIEQHVSSPFYADAKSETILVSLSADADQIVPYTVSIQKPVCVAAEPFEFGAPSSEGSVGMSSTGWWTTWQVDAVIQDEITNVSTSLRYAVRKAMTNNDKTKRCDT